MTLLSRTGQTIGRAWQHRYSRLAGWLLMSAGITLGAALPLAAPVAGAAIVIGFVFSRLWNWRTDPVEYEARFDHRTARATHVLRWGEICAGALLLAQLAAYSLDRDLIAIAFAAALLISVITAIRIDRPTHP